MILMRLGSTYQTVGVSTYQQPMRIITDILVTSDVTDDVTDQRWRRPGFMLGVSRSADVDSEHTHALHLTGIIPSLCDVIEPHAPETGYDVTCPSVFVARRVACRATKRKNIDSTQSFEHCIYTIDVCSIWHKISAKSFNLRWMGPAQWCTYT